MYQESSWQDFERFFLFNVLTNNHTKVIQNTSLRPMRTLTEHGCWNEISVLIRFTLMLSFNNRLQVLQFLPEIFHCVSIVVATGPVLIRSSVHGIVINVIQSMVTSQELSPGNLQAMKFLLNELYEPKTKLLFGLGRSNVNAFTRTAETTSSDTPEPMPLQSLDTIVKILLQTIQRGSPSIGERIYSWTNLTTIGV